MSEDYTQTVDFPDHKLGDQWVGISSIGPILINGLAPTETLWSIRAHFQERESLDTFRMSTDPGEAPDAEIVIDDPVIWTAHVPFVPHFLPRYGYWDYDMEFFSVGATTPLTLYKGTIFVRDDYTKPSGI